MYASHDVGLFGGLIFHSSDKWFKVKSSQIHPICYVHDVGQVTEHIQIKVDLTKSSNRIREQSHCCLNV